MSRKLYTTLDLVQNQLQNAVLHNLASAPSSPIEGQVYHNTSDHHSYVYNGTLWAVMENEATAAITALTGDVSAAGPGSVAATLATVNGSPGTFAIASVTVNAKGLVTSASAASTTGSGSVVLASSPTIVTPTIASFVNATHDHTNTAGGGQLNAGSVFSAGQVPLARGGTNADLSATGGANQFLKQVSSGAAITVAGITSGDLTTALTTPPAIGVTTPAAASFTNVTITGGGFIRPSADSTSALKITKADGTTSVVTVDTTNGTVNIVGVTGNTSPFGISANTAGSIVTLSVNNTAAFSTSNLAGQDYRLNTDSTARTALRVFASFSVTADATRTSTVTLQGNSAGSFTNILNIIGLDTQHYGLVSLGPGSSTPTKALDIYYGDVKFNPITAPGAATAALNGLGGSVDAGTHIYKITFVTAVGETTLGTASNTVTNDASNTQNSLTAIPLGTTSQGVTSRKVYRTKAGGATYFLLATIADNTTTTLADTTADASLGATDFTNKVNTTAGSVFIGNNRALTINNSLISLGINALSSFTSSANCVAIGNNALNLATTGPQNVAIGSAALSVLTTTINNVAVGHAAGQSTTGNRNTLFGSIVGQVTGSTPSASNALTSGNDNTFIGFEAGLESSTQRNFAIAIGSGSSVDASNTMALGGTTATNQVDIISGGFTASAKLHLIRLTALTNTVQDMLILDHNTSGTVANGLGAGFRIRARDNNVASKEMFYLQTVWFASADGSQQADAIFQVFDTAGREFMRARGSGTAAMIGVLGAAPVVRQVSGANLTNNVTTGGTDDTIANYTDLTTYANDAAAIRNNLYQLARKVKQLNDGLRLFGWYT